MNQPNVLFVTHKKVQCGVYEFGQDVFNAIHSSTKFNFILAECGDMNDLEYYYNKFKPDAIIYNYANSTMSWLFNSSAIARHSRLAKNRVAHFAVPQIGIIHEITQKRADTAISNDRKGYEIYSIDKSNSLFDFYIGPDPTLLLANPCVFKTGRVIPEYCNKNKIPETPVFGSAGFGSPNKQYHKIVQLVQEEFDSAEIRINIAFAEGDKNGKGAMLCAQQCRDVHTKEGIKLKITHEFWDKEGLLDFLAQNTLNMFLYNDQFGRGLSSIIDNALAVDRPIAISDSIMFRHIREANPSICVDDTNLRDIIKNGTDPIKVFQNEWTNENLRWDYERIVGHVLEKFELPKRTIWQDITLLIRSLIEAWIPRIIRKTVNYRSWLRSTEYIYTDNYKDVIQDFHYNKLIFPENHTFNGILDQGITGFYQPTISTLFKLVPNTMAKKHPKANVNQGFVFDTVMHFLGNYRNPKILCVGSYEDTACMALIKTGLIIEEIDPVINYTLQEYFTKPGIIKNYYDIIFSTSVIEHDPDDKSFMECVNDLLRPGGMFIMTCDFREGWKEGDPKPSVDARLYTKNDLSSRLLSYIPDCELIDTPNWDCLEPDFVDLSGNYTFASFVIKKTR